MVTETDLWMCRSVLVLIGSFIVFSVVGAI
jgi:hypothetical protein